MFFHQRDDFRIGDEIFNISVLKYFKSKFGFNFAYRDVNRYISAIDIFPDDLVVFVPENFYEYQIFYSGNLWYWNQMLREKKFYATSCIEHKNELSDIDIVFVPLLNPNYYYARGMKISTVKKLSELIAKKFPNSKIIIDAEKRNLINFDCQNLVFSSNVYETFGYIKRSKIYIGGDSGCSHFAGAIQHPNMILLYPDENVLEEKSGYFFKKEIVNMFGENEVLNYQYSSLPCCDPNNFQKIQLVANEISVRQLCVALEKSQNKKNWAS